MARDDGKKLFFGFEDETPVNVIMSRPVFGVFPVRKSGWYGYVVNVWFQVVFLVVC